MTAPSPKHLVIPADLLPGDGRFGSGPAKVRPEALDALAATGRTLLGTSHRQAPVRRLVAEVKVGLEQLFGLPEAYEVVLGNGGSTLFWDVAVASLIRHRSAHASFGEFCTAVSRLSEAGIQRSVAAISATRSSARGDSSANHNPPSEPKLFCGAK